MNFSEKLMYKAYAAALGTVITLLTQKAIRSGWKAATGQEPPQAGDPEVPAAEAFIWALSSGVGIGLAQLATTRYAARRWGGTGNKPTVGRTTFSM